MSLFDRVTGLNEDSRRGRKRGYGAQNPMDWDQMSRKLRKVHLGALKRAGVKPGRDGEDAVDNALDKDAKVRDFVGGHNEREHAKQRNTQQPQRVKTKGAAFEKAQAKAGQDAQLKRAQQVYARTKKAPRGFKVVFGKLARA